jgi:signal transduction histidine kinase
MGHLDISDDQLLAEIQRRLGGKTDECRDLQITIQSLCKQLRDSEKGKSAFLSNVRNEINNPLTSLMGLAEHVSQRSKEESIRKMGAWIHEQAFELDYQLRNIMVAAEIEMGEIKPIGSQIDIRSFLHGQVDYLKTRTEESNVRIKLEMETDALTFCSDPLLLQTICTNLLANAIEFSEKGQQVIVNARRGKETLYIQIQDFGMGIAPQDQEAIFSRFRQLDSGCTKSHPGQGLGLCIVHELIHMLGGKIKLDSELNRGTTVALQIPSIQSAPAFSSSGNEWIFTEGEAF